MINLKYIDFKYIVPIVTIVLILLIKSYFDTVNQYEHLTAISNEAIHNISSIYTSENLVVTNSSITNNLVANGTSKLNNTNGTSPMVANATHSNNDVSCQLFYKGILLATYGI
jgi:hypothetical protein